MISIDNLRTSLNTEFLGRQIKYMEETPSTNEDAWICLKKNFPEGTLIITDNQVNGKGRRSSKWLSTSNKSLTFSFLLLPKKNLEDLSLLPLLTGISIIKGIQNITKIQPSSIGVYVGLDFVGDGLIKLPFIRSLRQVFPSSRITWIAGTHKSEFNRTLAP